eukprot:4426011-Karenia_brevis.AAC.1
MRHAHRLREVTVQSIVESTATERLKAASSSKTRVAGENLKLDLGDLVDFYRSPDTKDEPGWIGPATVCELTDIERGIVHVKWQSRVIAVRIPDLRRSLSIAFLIALATWRNDFTGQNPTRLLVEFCHTLNTSCKILSWIHTPQGWVMSKDALKHYQIYTAI